MENFEVFLWDFYEWLFLKLTNWAFVKRFAPAAFSIFAFTGSFLSFHFPDKTIKLFRAADLVTSGSLWKGASRSPDHFLVWQTTCRVLISRIHSTSGIFRFASYNFLFKKIDKMGIFKNTVCWASVEFCRFSSASCLTDAAAYAYSSTRTFATSASFP